MSALTGHGLLHEGAAFSGNDYRPYLGTGGTGYARCSCGAKSAVLTSGNLRKAWHRAHKEEIRSAKQ